jgi:hypothetical protein
MEHKDCKTCGESKPWSDYYLSKGKPNGAKCKACLSEHRIALRSKPERKAKRAATARERYERNKEKIKAQRRKRYEANKDQELPANRVYRENNKQKIVEQKAAYYQANKQELQRKQADRIAACPSRRMAKSVSHAVQKALRKQGKVKGGRTFTALPYSTQDLVEHLEKQFDEKMNWGNYGSYWDLDHIYPQSLLPYDSLDHPNFQKCWALDNLQPLEHIANIRKSNRV